MAPIEGGALAGGLRGPAGYDDEPPRRDDLVVNAQTPYNAESPAHELTHSFVTPTDIFFVRNHGPVPKLDDESTFRLSVEGLVPNALSLSLHDIKNLPKQTVTATLQCAGNRRTEMSLKRTVKGVGWGMAAVGNGVWGGASLAAVLELAGIAPHSTATAQGGSHVEFISVDQCKEEEGGPYKGSIPLLHATSPAQQVLLAYEMNGEALTGDHGYPLRVVVPGVIGARSVKWLQRIVVRPTESDGFFVQRDYKMFPPTVDWHNIVWSSRRPIMDFPIQSAIAEPVDGTQVAPGQPITIRGYALSGGGRRVERVDVSVDGGLTWVEATRLAGEDLRAVGTHDAGAQEGEKTWHWVLWELRSTAVQPPCEIVVKAVDEASNTQPESSDVIWNLRGVLNNSWHRIKLLPAAGSSAVSESGPSSPGSRL